MTYIPNGELNIKWSVHQALLTKVSSGDANDNYRATHLNCMDCPVHLKTSDEEWYRMLNDIDGTA